MRNISLVRSSEVNALLGLSKDERVEGWTTHQSELKGLRALHESNVGCDR